MIALIVVISVFNHFLKGLKLHEQWYARIVGISLPKEFGQRGRIGLGLTSNRDRIRTFCEKYNLGRAK